MSRANILSWGGCLILSKPGHILTFPTICLVIYMLFLSFKQLIQSGDLCEDTYGILFHYVTML